MTDKVEITGLVPEDVLAALYNNTTCPPTPLCQMQDLGSMDRGKALEAMEQYGHFEDNNRKVWFDYVHGRPIKVLFVEDDDGRVWVERAHLYNRDSIKPAEEVIQELFAVHEGGGIGRTS